MLWLSLSATVPAVLVICLVLYIASLRSGIKEITKELDEKTNTDTNTLISVSSGDGAIKALAARLNTELSSLRAERLRLSHGDAELKKAVTNISHDLRTPLTAICGYLDLLETEDAPEKTAKYLSIIRERTDAMRSLTEEMLRYSVAVSAESPLVIKEVCVGDVLEQSLASFYGVLTERGITPDIKIPNEKIYLMLDPSALGRIFDNIISNAAKYSDGDLAVTLSESQRSVALSFENTSARLSRVQAEMLFDRFFTVETASASTGLGLSIAKALTEKMDGKISAEYDASKLAVTVVFPKKTEVSK